MTRTTLKEWILDGYLVTEGHWKGSGKSTMNDQIAHAHSEVSEVYQAIRHKEPSSRVLEEIADSVYAAMTLFHTCEASPEEIEKALKEVLHKISIRAGIATE